jgi:Protein of unknown function (DUF2817)
MPSYTRLIILQAAVVVLAVVYNFFTKYYATTPCSKDPPISFKSTKDQQEYTWDDTCRLYSTDYDEARNKFREAVQSYDNVERLSLPVTTGDDGGMDSLTIDIAIFPGNTAEFGTIVHSSGLHGVEGYAGSAIQLALLQKDILQLSSEKDRPTIVFLHALNPVGMKEHRRCNENNVDLNRNCIRGNFDDFVAQRDPNIANYDDFRRFLSPTDPNNDFIPLTPWYTAVGIWLNLIPQLFRYGFVALKRAMVSGQYHHSNGIFYGGQELQPSMQRLQEFWDSRLDLFQHAPSVIWIDVHTGLGPFGKDSIHYHPTAPSHEATGRFPETPAELQENHFVTSHSITQSVVQSETSEAFVGYELTKGMMTSFFAEIYDGSGLFMTQEFGTLPAIMVGRGLILDNMLYQQQQRKIMEDDMAQSGDPNIHDYTYRSPFLMNAFYPQLTAWRSSVVKRGVELMLQSVSLCRSKDSC